MFENEYTMDIRRYQRWTAPVFYRAKSFPLWVGVFLLGAAGTYFFYRFDVADRWKSLSLMLMLISVYRGYFFRRMYAGKQFKLMRVQRGKREWVCRITVGESIRLYLDGELNNEVSFAEIKRLTEAKSYFDLASENDFVRLDKAAFTKGDAESFRAWMQSAHPEIPHMAEAPDSTR